MNGHRLALTLACLFSAALASQNAQAGCEIFFDPPRINDDCQDQNRLIANAGWQVIGLDRAAKGLMSTGNMSVRLVLNSQASTIDTVIARVMATHPTLGQQAGTVQANEDSSTWIDVVLHASSAGGANGRQGRLETIHYAYQSGQVTAISRSFSSTFTLTSSSALDLSYQFQNGNVAVSLAKSDGVALGTLSVGTFGSTLPWFRVRSGAQASETGLETVTVANVIQ